jgi:Bacterial lipid A biosynthesis acyltransferase
MSAVSEITENAAVRLEEMPCEEQLVSELSSITDAQVVNLLGVRYRPILINLHSILHRELPPDRIRKLAVRLTKAAVWSGRAPERYLRSLPGAGFQYRLDGWDGDLLRSISRNGGGLLLCTFRYGLYGFLPMEIAARGVEVVCPLAELQYRGTLEVLSALKERVAALSGPVANISAVKLVPVDAPSAITDLAKALRRGGVGLIFADGNNGIDGPWGNEGRVDVEFFGSPASVKTGIAKLAWLFRCPILPVFPELRDGYRGILRFREPIIPPERGRATQEEFVSDCMARLYGLLEEEVRRSPAQWEGVSAVHRWRRSQVLPPSAPEEPVESVLQQGACLRINEIGGVVRTSGNFGQVWVDSTAMKGFRAPPEASALFDALAGQRGVDGAWMRDHRLEGDEGMMAILAGLWTRRLIIRA